MEDSFKLRVERLFGSHLFERVPKSSFPSSSWSVADGEVERRQWNRERGVDTSRDDTPCASAYDDRDGCFARTPRRRKALEDEEEEGAGGEAGDGDEDGEIRASVGLDPTLDREDEEDEYDRTAVGKEDTGDRVYMRDVNDLGPFINYHTVLSDCFDGSTEEARGFCRDPRADHIAANVRLNEDRVVAENLCTTESFDDYLVPIRCHLEPPRSISNLKPILKRKENQMDVRPRKQVRFDHDVCDNSTKEDKVSEDVGEIGTTAVTPTSESSKFYEDSPGVPDYIRNPSKYTCYTFDTNDKSDEESNRQAFEDFRAIISKSKSAALDDESGTDLPKSLVFIPRNKSMDAMVSDRSLREDAHSKSTGIAADEASESESCAMDEDEVSAYNEEKNTAPRKMDRKYRSKTASDLSES